MRLTGLLLVLICCFSIPAALAAPEKNSSINGTAIHLPTSNMDTVIIRFDYKQSALYHTFTFDVLDSIVAVLKRDKTITLSIDGYAYKDEGTDTICYYLSLNRALFIKTYILGRGIDISRIISVTGHGKAKSVYKGTDKDGFAVNCRAEISINFPPAPKKVEIADRDKDGIIDKDDSCPDQYGYKEKNGCPDTGYVLVPFETQQANLYTGSYKVLDSVISILTQNPALNVSIEGHAYLTEGISSICERLATERALIVKNYLLSRRIDISRIESVKSMGSNKPLNAGNNPLEISRNSRAEIFFSNR